MSRRLLAQNDVHLKFKAPLQEIPLTFLQKGFIETIENLKIKASKNNHHEVYLHFEGVKGVGIIPPIDVYINLEDKNQVNEQNYAGSFALFGLEESSFENAATEKGGQHQIVEISQLLRSLVKMPSWSNKGMRVTLKCSKTFPEGSWLVIGRISLSDFSYP